jgi:acetylornithine/succinyldiaminopimelate/putrescine aminotransferase
MKKFIEIKFGSESKEILNEKSIGVHCLRKSLFQSSWNEAMEIALKSVQNVSVHKSIVAIKHNVDSKFRNTITDFSIS